MDVTEIRPILNIATNLKSPIGLLISVQHTVVVLCLTIGLTQLDRCGKISTRDRLWVVHDKVWVTLVSVEF